MPAPLPYTPTLAEIAAECERIRNREIVVNARNTNSRPTAKTAASKLAEQRAALTAARAARAAAEVARAQQLRAESVRLAERQAVSDSSDAAYRRALGVVV